MSRARAHGALRWAVRIALIAFAGYCSVLAWPHDAHAAPPIPCDTYLPGTSGYPFECAVPTSTAAQALPVCTAVYSTPATSQTFCTTPIAGPYLPTQPPAPAPVDPAPPPASPKPFPPVPLEAPAAESEYPGVPVDASSGSTQHNTAVDSSSGLLGPLEATDADGNSLSRYDLWADDDWDPVAKVVLFLANLGFVLARTLVGIGSWILDLALSFGLLDLLEGPVQALTSALQTQIIGPMQLRHLVLVIAGALIMISWLRGQHTRALKDLAVSALIGAVAAVFLSNPAHTLMGDTGVLSTARDFSHEVGAIALEATGQESTSASDTVSGPLRAGLVDQLVVKPHQLIQFGTILDQPGNPQCVDEYEQIVSSGPHWADEDIPYDLMQACSEQLADYAHDSSLFDRVMGAWALAIAVSFIVAVIIALSYGLIFVAFQLARDVIMLLFDLIRGQLPGAGRDALVNRVRSIMECALLVMLSIFALIGFLIVVSVIFNANDSLMGRLVFLDLAAFAMFKFRKRIGAAARTTAARITHKARVSSTAASTTPGKWSAAALTTGAALSGTGAALGAAASTAADVKAKFIAPKNPSADVASATPTRAAARAGAGVVVGSTLGAPVYGPRAALAAAERIRRQHATAKRLVHHRAQQAKAFGAEYRANVAAVPRGIARAGHAVSHQLRIPPPPPPPPPNPPRLPKAARAPVTAPRPSRGVSTLPSASVPGTVGPRLQQVLDARAGKEARRERR